MKRYRKWVFVLIDILASVFGVLSELKVFYYIFHMLNHGGSTYDAEMLISSVVIMTGCIFLHNTISALFDLADKLEQKGTYVWKTKKHSSKSSKVKPKHILKTSSKNVE